jgi:hypothetical protein
MKKDQFHPDANQIAASAVRQTVDRHSEPLPADLEAAWKIWSASIAKVDERGWTLLRAAFEAGVDVGRRLKHT